MRASLLLSLALPVNLAAVTAQVPDNLMVERVPPITPELRRDAGRHPEFRSASFNSWLRVAAYRCQATSSLL